MKFQPDLPMGDNSITRVEADQVWVNGQAHASSILVPWQGAVQPWGVNRFEDLQAMHFEQMLSLKPELVIFGSGARIRFPSPALYPALINARIGIETMDLGAACRTYQVLASEGRSVLAALLIER
jgi:uncharacterized protein